MGSECCRLSSPLSIKLKCHVIACRTIGGLITSSFEFPLKILTTFIRLLTVTYRPFATFVNVGLVTKYHYNKYSIVYEKPWIIYVFKMWSQVNVLLGHCITLILSLTNVVKDQQQNCIWSSISHIFIGREDFSKGPGGSVQMVGGGGLPCDSLALTKLATWPQ